MKAKRWKVGERLLFTTVAFERVVRVKSINGYSKKTGELHLTLIDEDTGQEYNSAYDKDRIKIRL